MSHSVKNSKIRGCRNGIVGRSGKFRSSKLHEYATSKNGPRLKQTGDYLSARISTKILSTWGRTYGNSSLKNSLCCLGTFLARNCRPWAVAQEDFRLGQSDQNFRQFHSTLLSNQWQDGLDSETSKYSKFIINIM